MCIRDRCKLQSPKKNPEIYSDPLPDSLYELFHKRMLRHENRMIEQDVIQGENEAERLTLIAEKLDMVTWPMTLQKVTKINDPTDDDEMTRKRAQTIDSIKFMLEKFNLMKRKSIGLTGIQKATKGKNAKINPLRSWYKIYKRVDRSLIYPEYHSSSDEDEEEMEIDNIRNHRRKLREAQCGGSIIITLKNSSNYAIVAEPLRGPYVVKASGKEKRSWKKLLKGGKKFKYHPPLSNQVATPIRRRKVTFTLNKEVSDGITSSRTASIIKPLQLETNDVSPNDATLHARNTQLVHDLKTTTVIGQISRMSSNSTQKKSIKSTSHSKEYTKLVHDKDISLENDELRKSWGYLPQDKTPILKSTAPQGLFSLIKKGKHLITPPNLFKKNLAPKRLKQRTLPQFKRKIKSTESSIKKPLEDANQIREELAKHLEMGTQN